MIYACRNRAIPTKWGQFMKSCLSAVVVLAAVAGLAACGDDGGSAEEKVAGTLTITQTDYAFAVAGQPIAGNVSITVTNDGAEFHEIGMARLADGKTLEDLRTALAESSEENDDETFGGVIEADSAIDDLGGVQLPGSSYTIAGSGIKAGNYALLCFIPNAEGTPHYDLGMLTGFTVAEGESNEKQAADVTYTATDDALDGPESLKAGVTSVEMVNDSSVSREITVLKLKDGALTEEVGAWFESAGDGAPDPATAPLDFLAFIFDAEQDRTITLNLTPGQWVIGSADPGNPFEGPPTEDPHAIIITVT